MSHLNRPVPPAPIRTGSSRARSGSGTRRSRRRPTVDQAMAPATYVAVPQQALSSQVPMQAPTEAELYRNDNHSTVEFSRPAPSSFGDEGFVPLPRPLPPPADLSASRGASGQMHGRNSRRSFHQSQHVGGDARGAGHRQSRRSVRASRMDFDARQSRSEHNSRVRESVRNSGGAAHRRISAQEARKRVGNCFTRGYRRCPKVCMCAICCCMTTFALLITITVLVVMALELLNATPLMSTLHVDVDGLCQRGPNNAFGVRLTLDNPCQLGFTIDAGEAHLYDKDTDTKVLGVLFDDFDLPAGPRSRLDVKGNVDFGHDTALLGRRLSAFVAERANLTLRLELDVTARLAGIPVTVGIDELIELNFTDMMNPSDANIEPPMMSDTISPRFDLGHVKLLEHDNSVFALELLVWLLVPGFRVAVPDLAVEASVSEVAVTRVQVDGGTLGCDRSDLQWTPLYVRVSVPEQGVNTIVRLLRMLIGQSGDDEVIPMRVAGSTAFSTTPLTHEWREFESASPNCALQTLLNNFAYELEVTPDLLGGGDADDAQSDGTKTVVVGSDTIDSSADTGMEPNATDASSGGSSSWLQFERVTLSGVDENTLGIDLTFTTGADRSQATTAVDADGVPPRPQQDDLLVQGELPGVSLAVGPSNGADALLVHLAPLSSAPNTTSTVGIHFQFGDAEALNAILDRVGGTDSSLLALEARGSTPNEPDSQLVLHRVLRSLSIDLGSLGTADPSYVPPDRWANIWDRPLPAAINRLHVNMEVFANSFIGGNVEVSFNRTVLGALLPREIVFAEPPIQIATEIFFNGTRSAAYALIRPSTSPVSDRVRLVAHMYAATPDQVASFAEWLMGEYSMYSDTNPVQRPHGRFSFLQLRPLLNATAAIGHIAHPATALDWQADVHPMSARLTDVVSRFGARLPTDPGGCGPYDPPWLPHYTKARDYQFALTEFEEDVLGLRIAMTLPPLYELNGETPWYDIHLLWANGNGSDASHFNVPRDAGDNGPGRLATVQVRVLLNDTRLTTEARFSDWDMPRAGAMLSELMFGTERVVVFGNGRPLLPGERRSMSLPQQLAELMNVGVGIPLRNPDTHECDQLREGIDYAPVGTPYPTPPSPGLVQIDAVTFKEDRMVNEETCILVNFTMKNEAIDFELPAFDVLLKDNTPGQPVTGTLPFFRLREGVQLTPSSEARSYTLPFCLSFLSTLGVEAQLVLERILASILPGATVLDKYKEPPQLCDDDDDCPVYECDTLVSGWHGPEQNKCRRYSAPRRDCKNVDGARRECIGLPKVCKEVAAEPSDQVVCSAGCKRACPKHADWTEYNTTASVCYTDFRPCMPDGGTAVLTTHGCDASGQCTPLPNGFEAPAPTPAPPVPVEVGPNPLFSAVVVNIFYKNGTQRSLEASNHILFRLASWVMPPEPDPNAEEVIAPPTPPSPPGVLAGEIRYQLGTPIVRTDQLTIELIIWNAPGDSLAFPVDFGEHFTLNLTPPGSPLQLITATVEPCHFYPGQSREKTYRFRLTLSTTGSKRQHLEALIAALGDVRKEIPLGLNWVVDTGDGRSLTGGFPSLIVPAIDPISFVSTDDNSDAIDDIDFEDLFAGVKPAPTGPASVCVSVGAPAIDVVGIIAGSCIEALPVTLGMVNPVTSIGFKVSNLRGVVSFDDIDGVKTLGLPPLNDIVLGSASLADDLILEPFEPVHAEILISGGLGEEGLNPILAIQTPCVRAASQLILEGGLFLDVAVSGTFMLDVFELNVSAVIHNVPVPDAGSIIGGVVGSLGQTPAPPCELSVGGRVITPGAPRPTPPLGATPWPTPFLDGGTTVYASTDNMNVDDGDETPVGYIVAGIVGACVLCAGCIIVLSMLVFCWMRRDTGSVEDRRGRAHSRGTSLRNLGRHNSERRSAYGGLRNSNEMHPRKGSRQRTRTRTRTQDRYDARGHDDLAASAAFAPIDRTATLGDRTYSMQGGLQAQQVSQSQFQTHQAPPPTFSPQQSYGTRAAFL